jgi:hypothetical protein
MAKDYIMGTCPRCGMLLGCATAVSDGGLLSMAKALLLRRDNIDDALWAALEVEVIQAEMVREGKSDD